VIAVTGHKGFIGLALCKTLPKDSWVGIDQEDGGIMNLDLLRSRFQGSDTVVHLAARIGTRSNVPFQKFFDTNVTGTWNVVEAAKANDVKRLVFASTTTVRTLRNPYSVTKALSETLARGLCRAYGIDFVGLRIFNVYGPGQSTKEGALIPCVIEDIRTGRQTNVHGSGQQQRDFVYIDDVVYCIQRACASQAPFRGLCLDVGTGWTTRVLIVVRTLYEIANKQPQIRLVKVDEEASERWSRADNNLCKERFEISEFIKLRDGLETTYLSEVNRA
jgi:UDP-glucose 4-epimerase